MAPPSQEGPLPVELHEVILTHLRSDIGTLLALRGANKVFRALYAPEAFHTVRIDGSVDGALKLAKMFKLGIDIVQHVKHLEFRTLQDDPEKYFSEKVDEEMIIAFTRVWPWLSTLHYVTSATVILNDWGTCIERQSLFLVGLSHLPSGALQSLTITNFSPYNHSVFYLFSSPVLPSLRSVQSLSLSVTFFRGEEHGEIIKYNSIWRSDQFFSSMPDLKSLSIHSPLPIVGGAAFFTRFNHLESLSLEGFMLGNETRLLSNDHIGWWSAQDFVAMHGRTLKSLKLMNCAVLARVLEDGYRSPIPTAAATWMCLSEQMGALKEIEVTFDAQRQYWGAGRAMGRWKGFYVGTTRRADWWFFELFGEGRNHPGALPAADQIPNLEEDERELEKFITRVRERIPGHVIEYGEQFAKGCERLLAELMEYNRGQGGGKDQ